VSTQKTTTYKRKKYRFDSIVGASIPKVSNSPSKDFVGAVGLRRSCIFPQRNHQTRNRIHPCINAQIPYRNQKFPRVSSSSAGLLPELSRRRSRADFSVSSNGINFGSFRSLNPKCQGTTSVENGACHYCFGVIGTCMTSLHATFCHHFDAVDKLLPQNSMLQGTSSICCSNHAM